MNAALKLSEFTKGGVLFPEKVRLGTFSLLEEALAGPNDRDNIATNSAGDSAIAPNSRRCSSDHSGRAAIDIGSSTKTTLCMRLVP
jgi:hypothetical protein